MRIGWIAVALAGLALTANAPATDPGAEELRSYSKESLNYRSYPMGRIVAWEKDLRRALASGSLTAAADTLAPLYGVKSAVMRELVRLWLEIDIHQYRLDRELGRKDALRAALLALPGAADRDPLVIQAVAESLDRLDDCGAADFAALMKGSKDPVGDAWRIAHSATCTENFTRYLEVAGDRVAPGLIRQAGYGGLEYADSLPIYAWLVSPAGLAHVAERDRDRAAAIFNRNYAVQLFATGLSDRAVALLDQLPPAIRAGALSPDNSEMTLEIDGLPVTFREDRPDDSVRSYLAAAYALAGRDAEARELLDAIPEFAEAQRLFACAERPRANGRDAACKSDASLSPDAGLLVVDHWLDHRSEDPYPIAEYLAGSGRTERGGPFAEMRCRVFAEAQYAELCQLARDATRSQAFAGDPEQPKPDVVHARAAIAALSLPGAAAMRDDLAAALRAVAGTGPRATYWKPRATIDPDPPFAAQPLPAEFNGPRPKVPTWPKDVAKLPGGYFPVRIERIGQQVTAISISQNLDPTGEVTGGGYWLHLSDDGGRHWQTPLYTGLAQAFPYIVPESSRMMLRNGDAIDLEVEVSLIDTATIMYPPVATRTRRKESNLYVKLPLATLKRDSDGDGITDVAAHHLLLDRVSTDGGTPFRVGSDRPGSCLTPPTPEKRAILAMVRTLFEMPSQALVTRIDRAPDDFAGVLGGRAAISADRPMLLEGDPADYACLRAARPMIIYTASDIEALQRHTPDFRALSLPRIIYNRARDRGYVIWTTGWAGGTYRMRLVGEEWKFEATSSWIS